MRIVYFCPSLLSDWNNGNAHFLRGVLTELAARGHSVEPYEPWNAWSVRNLAADHGRAAVERTREVYPLLRPVAYRATRLDLDAALGDADLVIVHEWNSPALVRRIGRHRRRTGRYVLLFHDTHHRVLSDADQMAAYDLSGYDGVLAFGTCLREAYVARGWARRAWTWHEAADTRVFRPRPGPRQGDVVWVGNWGDEERTEELHEFLLEPVRDLRLRTRVYGVRYPASGLEALRRAGVEYGGWLANYDVPRTFGGFGVTLHVPRRPYVRRLPGIPTIRPFEALACGIPLISAPWPDTEGLFRTGQDYLVARTGRQMRRQLRDVLHDRALAAALAHSGRETVLARHTCAHRVSELLDIYGQISGRAAERTNVA